MCRPLSSPGGLTLIISHIASWSSFDDLILLGFPQSIPGRLWPAVLADRAGDEV